MKEKQQSAENYMAESLRKAQERQKQESLRFEEIEKVQALIDNVEALNRKYPLPQCQLANSDSYLNDQVDLENDPLGSVQSIAKTTVENLKVLAETLTQYQNSKLELAELQCQQPARGADLRNQQDGALVGVAHYLYLFSNITLDNYLETLFFTKPTQKNIKRATVMKKVEKEVLNILVEEGRGDLCETL